MKRGSSAKSPRCAALFALCTLFTGAFSTAQVTKTFEVILPGSTGSGSFTAAASVFNVSGSYIFTPAQVPFDLEITILGQTFTEINDISFNGVNFIGDTERGPIVELFDGELQYIDFLIREGDPLNSTEILQPGVSEISMTSNFVPTPSESFDYSVTMIPEPGVFGLFSGVVVLSALVVRRRRR